MNNSFSRFTSYFISKFFFIDSKANTFTNLKFITTDDTPVIKIFDFFELFNGLLLFVRKKLKGHSKLRTNNSNLLYAISSSLALIRGSFILTCSQVEGQKVKNQLKFSFRGQKFN
jgi:hypothetical protein